MIRALGQGVWREVGVPQFGHQDIGESPGGSQDRFSWECARILLGEGKDIRTWELVLPPVVEVTEDCIAVITGGDFTEIRVNGVHVFSNTVFSCRVGDRIEFGRRRMGFRSILACTPRTPETESRIGLERGTFSEMATWMDREQKLRVMPGPEAHLVPSLKAVVESRWFTGLASSDEGLRLEGARVRIDGDTMGQMVSAPVVDGTLQLTPDGLILLLRARPTIGGYPRIGVVLDADVDLAAQVPPRRKLSFRVIEDGEAQEVQQHRKLDLERFRQKCLIRNGNKAFEQD